MAKYQVQGRDENGQWDWRHIADSEAAATFDNEQAAADAVDEWCSERIGFDRGAVRYVAA